MGYVYVLLTVVLTVYGQLIIKWRVSHHGALPDQFRAKLLFLVDCLLDPFILSGFLAAFFASLMWIMAMSKLDISQAYPLVTAALTLLTVIGGVYLLSEPVTWQKLFGTLCIIAGVLVMRIGSQAHG